LIIILWAASFECLCLTVDNLIKINLRNKHLFINSIMNSTIFLFLYYFSIKNYGLLGAIIVRSINIAVYQLYPLIYTYKKILNKPIERFYFISIIITSLLSFGVYYFNQNLLLKILILFSTYAILVIFSPVKNLKSFVKELIKN